MPRNLEPFRVLAHNTARQSENRIHDDQVARRFGFQGALVPGVDVYAYMTHPVARRWGEAWLAAGAMSVRFLKPVYDGEEVVVTAVEDEDGTIAVAAESRGFLCATGRAELEGRAAVPPVDRLPAWPLPVDRPAASAESLAEGTVLGTWRGSFAAGEFPDLLQAVRETLPLYRERGLVQPGLLLRLANRLLTENVRLGPWMHVDSDMRLLGLAHVDEPLEARGRVIANFERRGHRFAELEVLVLGEAERPVMSARHLAIYQPRQMAP